MDMQQFATDIPREMALAAHSGTSFVPDKRAESEVSEWVQTLAIDYKEMHQHAEKGGTLDLLPDEFERYRQGLLKRELAYLGSRSGLMSTMIAGRSKFPAARMNKRADIVHKRLTEFLEFRERAKRAIRRNLRPDLRPIMASDADAIEQLQAKIAKAEADQDLWKRINKTIRSTGKKPKEDRIAALVGLGVSPLSAEKLLEPDFAGRTGVPGYMMTNNNANIRRMKTRVAQIERDQSAEHVEARGAGGIRFEDCPADNRVRLYFPDKPDPDVRASLKGRGFRWTPSLGCWQAYRNYNATWLAKQIAGIPNV